MHRAYILLIVLLVSGASGLVLSLGSHATYSLLGGNLASVFDGINEGDITAKAYVVKDLNTGEVVLHKHEDESLPIASITKLFTAGAVYDSGRAEEDALIVWQDVVTEGTAGALGLGEVYTLHDLLFPLLLSSSNDAAMALVRTLGNEAYASNKEQIIKDAGLKSTVIKDPSGLDDGNTSTAAELAAFLGYLRDNKPHVLDITRLKSYMGPYHGWINNNPGAAFPNWRGGKHGYTYAAGRTFAGIYEKEGREYAIVLLKSDDLSHDLKIALGFLP